MSPGLTLACPVLRARIFSVSVMPIVDSVPCGLGAGARLKREGARRFVRVVELYIFLRGFVSQARPAQRRSRLRQSRDLLLETEQSRRRVPQNFLLVFHVG